MQREHLKLSFRFSSSRGFYAGLLVTTPSFPVNEALDSMRNHLRCCLVILDPLVNLDALGRLQQIISVPTCYTDGITDVIRLQTTHIPSRSTYAT